MTYNRGWYAELNGTNFSRVAFKYRVLRYHDGKIETSGKGYPVIFLPGHKGDYQQVRSLGSVAKKISDENIRLDYFTLDFNDEAPGVVGFQVLDQAEFLNDAIRLIRKDYEADTPILIVGHSMGGFVARASFLMPNFDTTPCRGPASIFTLAAPHVRAPFGGDRTLNNMYSRVNDLWRDATRHKVKLSSSEEVGTKGVSSSTCEDDSNRTCGGRSSLEKDAATDQSDDRSRDGEETVRRRTLLRRVRETLLVSIAGGWRDSLVPSSITDVVTSRIVPVERGLSVLSSRIRLSESHGKNSGVRKTSCDHLSILWCNQVVVPVTKSLHAIVLAAEKTALKRKLNAGDGLGRTGREARCDIRDGESALSSKVVAHALFDGGDIDTKNWKRAIVMEANRVRRGEFPNAEFRAFATNDEIAFRIGQFLRQKAENVVSVWVALCFLVLSALFGHAQTSRLSRIGSASNVRETGLTILEALRPDYHLPLGMCTKMIARVRSSAIAPYIVGAALCVCACRELVRGFLQIATFLPDFVSFTIRVYALGSLETVSALTYRCWLFALALVTGAFRPLSIVDLVVLYAFALSVLTLSTAVFGAMRRATKSCASLFQFPSSRMGDAVTVTTCALVSGVFAHCVQLQRAQAPTPSGNTLQIRANDIAPVVPVFVEIRGPTLARESAAFFLFVVLIFVCFAIRATLQNLISRTSNQVFSTIALMAYVPIPSIYVGVLLHALEVLLGPESAATSGSTNAFLWNAIALVVSALHLRLLVESDLYDDLLDDKGSEEESNAQALVVRAGSDIVCECSGCRCPTALFERVWLDSDCEEKEDGSSEGKYAMRTLRGRGIEQRCVRFENGEVVYLGTTYRTYVCECPKYFRKKSQWCEWCMHVYAKRDARRAATARFGTATDAAALLGALLWCTFGASSAIVIAFVVSTHLIHRLQYAYIGFGVICIAVHFRSRWIPGVAFALERERRRQGMWA